MKWNLPITLYTHAHSSILKKKIEYLLSRQLREMMCKRLLGVHKQPRTERAIHPEKIKIKKTMKRSDKQQSSGWVHAVCHTQRGVKRRSRSNHWLDSVVQQRAGSVLMLSARYIFQRLNGGNPKTKRATPHQCFINQMCVLVWRSTQTPPQIPIQEKGSRAAKLLVYSSWRDLRAHQIRVSPQMSQVYVPMTS